MGKLAMLNPRRLVGNTYKTEKRKAAVLLKMFEPVARQSVHAFYMLNFYRHIDKALSGKTKSSDAKHWKKMYKTFKAGIVGTQSICTGKILAWLSEFRDHVEDNAVTAKDLSSGLPKFKEWLEVQEKDELNNYILKNKLME